MLSVPLVYGLAALTLVIVGIATGIGTVVAIAGLLAAAVAIVAALQLRSTANKLPGEFPRRARAILWAVASVAAAIACYLGDYPGHVTLGGLTEWGLITQAPSGWLLGEE
jgi:hypothetical protein